MPTAKENFLSRLINFEKVVSPENPADSVLVSRSLSEISHNERVKMLRNGLAIVSYTMLEDFIKKRVGEVFKELGTSGIDFNSLPEKLKDLAVLGALNGVKSIAEMRKRNSEDYISFIQDETSFISSTKNTTFELSEYSFGWSKSNLSAEDINTILSIFNVAGGWDNIRSISSIININLLNPKEIFTNAARRRHSAAHDSNADSLLVDLQSYVTQSRVIAFGVDTLITQSLRQIKNNNINFLNGSVRTAVNQLSFRYIVQEDDKWKEKKTLTGRAYRIKFTLDEILPQSQIRAKNNNEILLIKASNNQILDWKIEI